MKSKTKSNQRYPIQFSANILKNAQSYTRTSQYANYTLTIHCLEPTWHGLWKRKVDYVITYSYTTKINHDTDISSTLSSDEYINDSEFLKDYFESKNKQILNEV